VSKCKPGLEADLVSHLCPTCALCCNGVLFNDVQLRVGDDPARLTDRGVPLKKHGSTFRLQQPCSCLESNRCRVYADRPERCRTFECRLLQRAQSGEVTEAAALKAIQQARRRADSVRRILRELGDTNESVPLTRRYQRMMRQPIDLSAGQRFIDLRGELMTAVAEMVGQLEKDFLS